MFMMTIRSAGRIDPSEWPGPEEKCPLCGERFGERKLQRLPDGTVVHRACQIDREEEKIMQIRYMDKRWNELMSR